MTSPDPTYDAVPDRATAPASETSAAGPARVTLRTLSQEAKTVGSLQLAEFLAHTGRAVTDVYRGTSTWTAILRRAELIPTPTTPVPDETALLKRLHAFLHISDTERVAVYRQFTADDAPAYDDLTEREQTLARMLFFNLWDKGGFDSYTTGLASLRGQHQVRSELGQLLTYLMHSDRVHAAQPLTGPHTHIPMNIHHAYNRSEILAATGVARLGGQLPGFFAQGVLWDPANSTDILWGLRGRGVTLP